VLCTAGKTRVRALNDDSGGGGRGGGDVKKDKK